jgi:GTP-binding protein
MSFIDLAVVRVAAGVGGSGACSFARFKFKPKGGPDGGDGGRGGSVYVQADSNLATLLDYTYRPEWQAQRGQHGKGKKMTGASGADLVMPVPVGTVIRNAVTREILGEALDPSERILLAKGGRGGKGNARFATSTHQAPREWEPGGEGESLEIELELKLIADVGLVGEPNAGKSTFLSVISAARPKIADYPFTTLTPNLGVVGLSNSRSFVVADVPGIIEGAHQGKGLGLTFLRHIERTRVLAFLVPLAAEEPQVVYHRLRQEIKHHSEALFDRPHILVLTKRDLLPPEDVSGGQVDAPDAVAVHVISSVTGAGVEKLVEDCWALVNRVRVEESDGPIHTDVDDN